MPQTNLGVISPVLGSSTGSDFTTTSATAVPVASAAATATITIASPAVVSMTVAASHTIYNNMPIHFTTTGTLPTGIVANTVYYVQNVSGSTGAVNFNIASTPNGSSINTSGTQSGVQSCFLHTLSAVLNTVYGRPATVLCQADGTANAGRFNQTTSNEAAEYTIYVYRNGVQIAQLEQFVVASGGVNTGFALSAAPSSIFYVDVDIVGVPGTYVYSIYVANTPTAGTIIANYMQMMAYEMV